MLLSRQLYQPVGRLCISLASSGISPTKRITGRHTVRSSFVVPHCTCTWSNFAVHFNFKLMYSTPELIFDNIYKQAITCACIQTGLVSIMYSVGAYLAAMKIVQKLFVGSPDRLGSNLQIEDMRPKITSCPVKAARWYPILST